MNSVQKGFLQFAVISFEKALNEPERYQAYSVNDGNGQKYVLADRGRQLIYDPTTGSITYNVDQYNDKDFMNTYDEEGTWELPEQYAEKAKQLFEKHSQEFSKAPQYKRGGTISFNDNRGDYSNYFEQFAKDEHIKRF